MADRNLDLREPIALFRMRASASDKAQVPKTGLRQRSARARRFSHPRSVRSPNTCIVQTLPHPDAGWRCAADRNRVEGGGPPRPDPDAVERNGPRGSGPSIPRGSPSIATRRPGDRDRDRMALALGQPNVKCPAASAGGGRPRRTMAWARRLFLSRASLPLAPPFAPLGLCSAVGSHPSGRTDAWWTTRQKSVRLSPCATRYGFKPVDTRGPMTQND